MKEYKVVIQKQEMEMNDGEKLEVGTKWLMDNNEGYIKVKRENDTSWGHWGKQDGFEDWFEITDEVVYE